MIDQLSKVDKYINFKKMLKFAASIDVSLFELNLELSTKRKEDGDRSNRSEKKSGYDR